MIDLVIDWLIMYPLFNSQLRISVYTKTSRFSISTNNSKSKERANDFFFYDQILSHCELEITPISGQYNYTETFDHDALTAIIPNIKHIKN